MTPWWANAQSVSAIVRNVKVARPKIIAAVWCAVKRSRSSALISFSRTENVKAPLQISDRIADERDRDEFCEWEMIPFIFTLWVRGKSCVCVLRNWPLWFWCQSPTFRKEEPWRARTPRASLISNHRIEGHAHQRPCHCFVFARGEALRAEDERRLFSSSPVGVCCCCCCVSRAPPSSQWKKAGGSADWAKRGRGPTRFYLCELWLWGCAFNHGNCSTRVFCARSHALPNRKVRAALCHLSTSPLCNADLESWSPSRAASFLSG